MAIARLMAAAMVSFVLVACTPPASPAPTATPADTPAATPAATPAGTPAATPTTAPTATAAASPTAEPSPSPAALDCGPDSELLKNAGRLTIATDNPAFPPYFDPPAEGETAASPVNQEDPWALGDPTNKRGFEAAVAWEIASRLGFADDDVDWMFVAWDNLWSPGAKEFDFGLAQISYTDERAQQIDMSRGYYFVNQALVAPVGSELASATTMDEIRGFRLGAQRATTSFQYIEEVIQPTQPAQAYNENIDAIAALVANQIDGIVVDLPTAFFINAVQLPEAGIGGDIVGVFPAAGEEERFSIVAEQGSGFIDCVNQALDEMEADGTLESITDEWLTGQADAPIIEP